MIDIIPQAGNRVKALSLDECR